MGLGDAGHLATHTEGFSYALPLAPSSRILCRSSWAPPREQPRESMHEPRQMAAKA